MMDNEQAHAANKQSAEILLKHLGALTKYDDKIECICCALDSAYCRGSLTSFNEIVRDFIKADGKKQG